MQLYYLRDCYYYVFPEKRFLNKKRHIFCESTQNSILVALLLKVRI